MHLQEAIHSLERQGVNCKADSLTTVTLEKMAVALDVPVWQLLVSPADVIPATGVTISCPHCGKPLKITGV